MTQVLAQGIRETTFLHEKTFKATTTGLTRLREGRYASRYRLGSGYAVTARGEIIVKPKPPGSPCKRPKDPEKQLQDPKQPRTYRIAKQVVRNRIRAMVNMLQRSRDRMGKPKLYFWTVTFPEGTPDAVCYRLHNIWLTSLRQLGLLKSYLWIAERQKNGTIHYHLAIPHYLHHLRANAVMRQALLDLESKGANPKWDRLALYKYNGVHIAKNKDTKREVNFASTKKERSLSRYLTKYLTKNDAELPHFAWHCSRDWSGLILGVTCTRTELGKFVTRRMLDLESLSTEYCEFYRWKNYRPPDPLVDHLARINYDLLLRITGGGHYLYCLN
jgi:hypothetical protein